MKNLSPKELAAKIPEELKKDPDVKNFFMGYSMRSLTEDWYQYENGNGYVELNKKNGSLITTVLTDDDFEPAFPLNMDMNISNRCVNGCDFCYAGCTPTGKNADLKTFIKSEFFQSLHGGTELALNGNEPFHPDLELLLTACREREIVANLTVRYNTFCNNRELLQRWQQSGLVHGIGVSVCENMDFDVFTGFENIVFHTIVGITSEHIFNDIMNHSGKVLILGYKTFGLGVQYADKECDEITKKRAALSEKLSEWIARVRDKSGFSVISFDNLALEQLHVKSLLSEKEWGRFFRGDDGHHTMYVDLVDLTYCKNSMMPNKYRYSLSLHDTVEKIFCELKERIYEEK